MIEQIGRAGVWSYDFQTGKYFWSEGMFRLLGLAPYSVEPGPDILRQLVPQDQVDGFELPFFNVTRGIIKNARGRLRLPNGVARWLECQSEIILGDDGKNRRVFGVAFDVTEQQLAVEELGRRDALFSILTEELDIYFLNKNGELSAESLRSWELLTRHSREEIVTHGWRLAVHPSDEGDLTLNIAAAQSGERSSLTGFRWVDDQAITRLAYAGFARRTRVEEQKPAGFILYLPEEMPSNVDARELTGAAVRAARGLLDWTVDELSSASGVSASTIRRMESQRLIKMRDASGDAILQALTRRGVIFGRNQYGNISVSAGPNLAG